MTPGIAHIASGLAHALYRLCRVFPVRKRIVCLSRQQNGSTADFSLLRSCVEKEHPDWNVIILAKTLDSMASYAPHMLKQIYYLATSEMVVLDSYCIVVSLLGRRIKAPVLQMWHALGNMKKFGYMTLDTPEGRSTSEAKLWHMHEGYDSVLVSSMSFADDLAAGFNVPTSLLYEAPLPRVDLLIDPQARSRNRQRVFEALPQLSNGKKTIVYCPTFRREPAPNEKQAMKALIDAVDFQRYNLIFKRHPVSTQVIDDPRVIQDYPRGIDPLYAADYAISDYSTVIYEAGLLGIPVFLYAYDWNTYHAKRSLNIDIEHDVPTLFTSDARAILSAIENDDFDAQAYSAFIRNNIALPAHGSCTERIVKHIWDMMRNGKTAPDEHATIR
jgi:CDP-ribitol ribitolphosphotransferase